MFEYILIIVFLIFLFLTVIGIFDERIFATEDEVREYVKKEYIEAIRRRDIKPWWMEDAINEFLGRDEYNQFMEKCVTAWKENPKLFMKKYEELKLTDPFYMCQSEAEDKSWGQKG